MSTLIATLGLDQTGFETGLKKADRSIKSLAGAFGLAFGAGSIALATRQASEFAEQIDRSALKTGVTTTEFQRLNFAVTQNKGSTDNLERSLIEIGKRAAATPQYFEKWGVSLNNADGSAKTINELFFTIAERIENAATQQERLGLASELMGRSGTELVPILQQGVEAINELGNQANIMSENSIKSIAKVNDAIDAIKISALVKIGNLIGAIINPREGSISLLFLELATILQALGNFIIKIPINLWGAITSGVGTIGVELTRVALNAGESFITFIRNKLADVLEKAPGFGGVADALRTEAPAVAAGDRFASAGFAAVNSAGDAFQGLIDGLDASLEQTRSDLEKRRAGDTLAAAATPQTPAEPEQPERRRGTITMGDRVVTLGAEALKPSILPSVKEQAEGMQTTEQRLAALIDETERTNTLLQGKFVNQ